MKILLILSLTLGLMACSKNNGHHDCYDESLVHNNACTHDCPGFTAVMVKLIAMDVKRKGKELGHNKVNLLSLLKTCFNLRYNQSHLVLI
jgi:hypothetical protein